MSGIIDIVGSKSGVVGSSVIPGHVLQVESFCLTATQSISIGGGAVSAVTNLIKAITPSTSNSKMWIMANISWTSSSNWGYFTINSSVDGDIGIGDAVGSSRQRNGAGASFLSAEINVTTSCQFLDTPSNHSSAITYGIKIGNGGASTHTHYLNTNSSSDITSRSTFASTITIMEIAQ
tara:strand:- start:329 stop:862 length:534 start_codon:yes stop_codon:yes gene_type:complete